MQWNDSRWRRVWPASLEEDGRLPSDVRVRPRPPLCLLVLLRMVRQCLEQVGEKERLPTQVKHAKEARRSHPGL